MGSYMVLTVDKSLTFGSLVEFDAISRLLVTLLIKMIVICIHVLTLYFSLFRWLPNCAYNAKRG